MKRGIVVGVFDLFHYGHLLALHECKEHCDHLTVALNKAENIDPEINPNKKPPVFPIEHRVAIMESCNLVDEVLTYNSEEELIELLKKGNYDVRFLGDDYKGRPITGDNLTKEIYYTDRSHGWSTSKFKKIIKES
ncbi:MAG: adenylyltransferase/cytidyltransferase family protein [Saprospiraceae bacterium]